MSRKLKKRKAARRTRAGKRKVKERPRRRKIASRIQKQAIRRAYRADQTFPLFKELRALIVKAAPESFPWLERRLKRLGGIKLAVVTGVFLNINDSRVDLLLVGDNIQIHRLINIIRELETELGKEIRYVTLSVSEFKYRYEMYDRFLHDIFDCPHEVVIKRLRLQDD